MDDLALSTRPCRNDPKLALIGIDDADVGEPGRQADRGAEVSDALEFLLRVMELEAGEDTDRHLFPVQGAMDVVQLAEAVVDRVCRRDAAGFEANAAQ